MLCGANTDMSKFKFRILGMDDWRLYREVRLSSLKDSPDSFGSTYAREIELSDLEWQSRLDLNSQAKSALPLVAEIDGHVVGLAWGLIHEPDTKVVHIYQMWVSPAERGKGIGKALLHEIETWAKGRGCDLLALDVTTTNDAAVGLYLSSGFVPVGQQGELRAGSTLKVQPMIRELHCAA